MPVEGYAINWIAVVIAATVGTGALTAMLVANILLAPRRPSKKKEVAYESGILPTRLDWTQFTVRYYIFAILFLIFELPWQYLLLLKQLSEVLSSCLLKSLSSLYFHSELFLLL